MTYDLRSALADHDQRLNTAFRQDKQRLTARPVGNVQALKPEPI